jgi:hypothetical protein
MCHPDVLVDLSDIDEGDQVGFLRAVKSMTYSDAVDLIVHSYPKLNPQLHLEALEAIRFTIKVQHRVFLNSIIVSGESHDVRWLAFDILCNPPFLINRDMIWLTQIAMDQSAHPDFRSSAVFGLFRLLNSTKSDLMKNRVNRVLRICDPQLTKKAMLLFGETSGY